MDRAPDDQNPAFLRTCGSVLVALGRADLRQADFAPHRLASLARRGCLRVDRGDFMIQRAREIEALEGVMARTEIGISLEERARAR